MVIDRRSLYLLQPWWPDNAIQLGLETCKELMGSQVLYSLLWTANIASVCYLAFRGTTFRDHFYTRSLLIAGYYLNQRQTNTFKKNWWFFLFRNFQSNRRGVRKPWIPKKNGNILTIHNKCEKIYKKDVCWSQSHCMEQVGPLSQITGSQWLLYQMPD